MQLLPPSSPLAWSTSLSIAIATYLLTLHNVDIPLRYPPLFATDPHLPRIPCAAKRTQWEGVISPTECKLLLRLADVYGTRANVGVELYGADLHQIDRADPRNEASLKVLASTRHTMKSIVDSYFNVSTYVEFTHLTARKHDKFPHYSHGIHADQCDIQRDGICRFFGAYCCGHRSISSILYLADGGVDFEGGEFVFENDLNIPPEDPARGGCIGEQTRIVPKCGNMVAFTSGPENVHSVLQVRNGTRYAMAMWFTADPYFSEYWDLEV